MTLRNTKPFKDIVDGLIGRDASFAYGKGVDPDGKSITGVYVDPNNILTSVIQFDLPLTAYLGAAVGMLPKGRADDNIESAIIEQDLEENASEVLNVLAAALTDELELHQRLDEIHSPGSPLPQPVAVLAGSPARLDFTVTIPGYGDGALSIVVFPS